LFVSSSHSGSENEDDERMLKTYHCSRKEFYLFTVSKLLKFIRIFLLHQN
jgi:hypothetical protein